MSKTVTKAQAATLAKLKAARESAIQDVYHVVAPRMDVPFQTCLQVASQAIRDAYESANRAHWQFEDSLVADGRAYRATFGMFTPY